MQGQRSSLDSFQEPFGIDHGSSTSETGVDQQLYWNDMLNPVENGFPGCLLPPGETSSAHLNSACVGRSLSSWNLGERISGESSRNQMIQDEPKVDQGWPYSFSSNAGSGSRLEERPQAATNSIFSQRINIDLNSNQETNGPLFPQTSRSSEIRPNLNLNTAYPSSNDGQLMELGTSHMYRPGGSETEHTTSSSGPSVPFGTAAGSPFLTEENDGPSFLLDGRRSSCKRKTLDGGASGQLSLDGSPSCYPGTEDSVWHAFPARYNAASSSGMSTSSERPMAPNLTEQLNSQVGIGFRGVASDGHPPHHVAAQAESSRRNSRMRINPPHLLDLAPSSQTSTGPAARIPHVWPPQRLPSRHAQLNHSLDLMLPAPTISFQSLSQVTHAPSSSRNAPPFPYNGAPNTRAGGSSTSTIFPGERPAVREEMHSRSISGNSGNPMLVPASEMRNLTQNPTDWSLASGSTSVPRLPASRVGSSSGVYPSQAPTWVPPTTTQYSRRLSDAVRRSLHSSGGSEAGSQSSNFPPLHSGLAASSQEVVLPAAGSPAVNHQPHPRSAALWMERQADGVPLSLRSLAAAGGRRGRLLSEIRNVLDIVRRGGDGLRFEDVFILDHSVFLGVADLHDRHRDMRLDVDNMSYEELLALEERIGDVNTGLSEETISKCLKQRKYFTVTVDSASEVKPCCVCQEDYTDGEDLGALDCGHDFHSKCIKQWLKHKNTCPICKTTALVT